MQVLLKSCEERQPVGSTKAERCAGHEKRRVRYSNRPPLNKGG